MTEENKRAVIGDNNPPEDETTPFEKWSTELQDLYDTAKDFADGQAIESQDLADTIDDLVKQIKACAKTGDAMRKDENKPFDDGKKAVQAKYNPFIQKDKGKADLAISACNALLTPWKQKKADKLAAEQERQRKEAEETRRLANEKMQAAVASGDLEAREEAENLGQIAKMEDQIARKTSRETVKGMRTERVVTVVNSNDFAKWLWVNKRDDMIEWMRQQAKRYDREGLRGMYGVEVKEQKVAR